MFFFKFVRDKRYVASTVFNRVGLSSKGVVGCVLLISGSNLSWYEYLFIYLHFSLLWIIFFYQIFFSSFFFVCFLLLFFFSSLLLLYFYFLAFLAHFLVMTPTVKSSKFSVLSRRRNKRLTYLLSGK